MKTLAALCYYSCLLTISAVLLQATWLMRREHVIVPKTTSVDLAGSPARNVSPKAAQRPVLNSYGDLPLTFETNQGQTDPQVKFLSHSSGYTVFLTQTSAVLVLRRSSKGKSGVESRQTDLPRTAARNSNSESLEMKGSKSSKTRAVVRMELVGANPMAHAFGFEDLPGKSNYFLGKDPKKWRTNIPTYAKVKYQNIYPGVDLVYYGSQRRMEYDFVVAPGCDPRGIALEFRGADKISVDSQGDLVLQMGAGDLRLRKPAIYQLVNGMRRSVSGNYILRDKRFVSFRVEAHDSSKPLVVDPVLVYSTYLGGSGDDFGNGIAVDGAGNAYVTGGSSPNFSHGKSFPRNAGRQF